MMSCTGFGMRLRFLSLSGSPSEYSLCAYICYNTLLEMPIYKAKRPLFNQIEEFENYKLNNNSIENRIILKWLNQFNSENQLGRLHMRDRYKIYTLLILITGFSLWTGIVTVSLAFSTIENILMESEVWFALLFCCLIVGGFSLCGWLVIYLTFPGYYGLYREMKSKPILPGNCIECDESMQPDEIEWIGRKMVECPFCGASMKVTTYWDELY